jgi:hypothetical protein
MRNDLVQIMGNRLEPLGRSLRRRPGTGSDHVGSSLPLNPGRMWPWRDVAVVQSGVFVSRCLSFI